MDHGHSHDHEHGDDEGYSLHEAVDKDKVRCLNEAVAGSCKKVIKTFEDRFSNKPSLVCQEWESDDYDDEDEEKPELLLHVPFSEAVSVHHICVRGPEGNETSAPSKVKIFVDRDDIDFELARELKPVMEIDFISPEHEHEVTANHQHDGEGPATIDYPVRPAGKFQNISSITMYFPDNFDSRNGHFPQTEISYVGFKGKGTNVKRRAVDCVYESRGMKKDHTVPSDEMGMRDCM